MNINDVVAKAMEFRRNNESDFRKYELVADAKSDTVMLNVYPYNNRFKEIRTGAIKFYIHDGKVQSVWING